LPAPSETHEPDVVLHSVHIKNESDVDEYEYKLRFAPPNATPFWTHSFVLATTLLYLGGGGDRVIGTVHFIFIFNAADAHI
jgi:hypothetical protein